MVTPNDSTDSARTALPPSRYGPWMVQCLRASPGVVVLEEVAGVFVCFFAIGCSIASWKSDDDDYDDDDDDNEWGMRNEDDKHMNMNNYCTYDDDDEGEDGDDDGDGPIGLIRLGMNYDFSILLGSCTGRVQFLY